MRIRAEDDRAGDEVVQRYVTRPAAGERTPLRALAAFARVHLAPGERQMLPLHAPASAYAVWDSAKAAFRTIPGSYELAVGASSDDIRLRATVIGQTART